MRRYSKILSAVPVVSAKNALVGVVAVALTATCFAISSPLLADPTVSNQSRNETPSEMLQDAMEALADRQPHVARSLFEQVVLSYPGSPEAENATKELLRLDTADAVVSAQSASQSASPSEKEAPAREPVRERANREAPPSRSIEELRQAFLLTTGDRVFFPANSATIGGRAKAMLENQARWLQLRPGITIKIIGRADDDTPANEALELSAKRAEAVREQLLGLGIAAQRIMVEGRGDKDPVATCRTDACKIQNRLAETFLIENRIVTGEQQWNDGGAGGGEEPLPHGVSALDDGDRSAEADTIAR